MEKFQGSCVEVNERSKNPNIQMQLLLIGKILSKYSRYDWS